MPWNRFLHPTFQPGKGISLIPENIDTAAGIYVTEGSDFAWGFEYETWMIFAHIQKSIQQEFLL